MIIKNAAVYCADFLPVETDIETENEKIKSIGKTDKDGIDFSGCCVLPGFIDIHIHGCNMADATDGKSNSISEMSVWLAKKGVTSFCPATMTISAADIEKSFINAATTMGKERAHIFTASIWKVLSFHP